MRVQVERQRQRQVRTEIPGPDPRGDEGRRDPEAPGGIGQPVSSPHDQHEQEKDEEGDRDALQDVDLERPLPHEGIIPVFQVPAEAEPLQVDVVGDEQDETEAPELPPEGEAETKPVVPLVTPLQDERKTGGEQERGGDQAVDEGDPEKEIGALFQRGGEIGVHHVGFHHHQDGATAQQIDESVAGTGGRR